MSTKLFVGSLAWATTDDSLQQFFSQAGTVVSAKVITDRMSGRSKGFGFVEMSSEEEAKNAIEMLNGQKLDEREIIVSEARPQETNRQGGGGGYQNRGGYGGGSRGGYNNRGSYNNRGGSRGGYQQRNSQSNYSDRRDYDQNDSVSADDSRDMA